VGDDFEEAQRKIDACRSSKPCCAQLRQHWPRCPPRPAPAQNAQEAAGRKRRQLIKLLAEIEKRINEENARPKKRYISPATREEVYAVYYDQLRRKVEDKGTENFPEYGGKKLYGELVMILTVNHDGRVLGTEIVQGSGNRAGPPRRGHCRGAGPSALQPAMRRRPTRSPWSRASSSPATKRWKPPSDDPPHRPVLRHGQPGGAQPLALDPRPLCRTHRPGPGVRTPPGAAGRLWRCAARLCPGGRRGCNVTVPFKLEAAQAASVRSERVQLAGAANTLSFIDGAIHADNTDGLGLVADIEQRRRALAGRDVLLSARAAPPPGRWARCWPGPRRMVVANRTLERAQALVQAHAALQRYKQSCSRLPQALEHDFDSSSTPPPAAWRRRSARAARVLRPAAWPTT
jgi:hypothetical protein